MSEENGRFEVNKVYLDSIKRRRNRESFFELFDRSMIRVKDTIYPKAVLGLINLRDGIPERIVIGNNKVVFVNIRKAGSKTSDSQKITQYLLERAGFKYVVYKGKEETIEEIVKYLEGKSNEKQKFPELVQSNEEEEKEQILGEEEER